jgi:hypothetical protein
MNADSLVANVLGASSGVAIATKAGNLYGLNVYLTGTDELTIYDNASAASGTVLFYAKGAAANCRIPNAKFVNGMYAVQTGTGSKTVIYYNG